MPIERPTETHPPGGDGFASPAIEASEVGVTLDKAEILRGVTFGLDRGCLIGLIGPNGSGKTTLLRALSGVIPFRGDIRIAGRPIQDWKPRERARRIAFVRQSLPLSFDFSVSELVLLGRSPHKGWSVGYTSEDHALLAQALEYVDLSGFEERGILSLSGGERRRALLAQALVQETDLLLLDEPTAHLDVHYQFGFMKSIQRLVKQGRTVLAVFHDLELAGRFADELLVLHDGRLVAAGSPATVLTPELISDAFRMNAEVVTEPDGHLHIRYHTPMHPCPTP